MPQAAHIALIVLATIIIDFNDLVIKNAVEWARNRNTPKHQYGNAQPLEEISEK